MSAVSHDDAGAALDRLFKIAEDDHGGSAMDTGFLLAWWDSTTGLISMAGLCCLDPKTREDILTIIAYITQAGITYAYA